MVTDNYYPIIINCRDRLTSLQQLVAWIETTRHEDIFLLDNASTYEPLLEYYKQTPHTVIHTGQNKGHHSPWREDIPLLCTLRQQYFVVTDPDVVPIEECPKDALDYFFYLLCRHPDRTKIGFSLKIDDLPDHFMYKKEVIKWEEQFYHVPKLEDKVFAAPVDTTFALYRPGAGPHIDSCARTDYPYQARHMPWYSDSKNMSAEELYYLKHAETKTHWSCQDYVNYGTYFVS